MGDARGGVIFEFVRLQRELNEEVCFVECLMRAGYPMVSQLVGGVHKGWPCLGVTRRCDSRRCNVSGINTARVVIGGIVAGLVINVSEFILNMVVLGADMNAAMTRLNLPPFGGQAIAVFVVLGFALGLGTAWLYAAIRPRYGPGPRTALCAGAAVWFFAYFYGGVGMMVMGMFPGRMMAVGMIWGLGEVLLASVAGAFLYRE